MPPMDNPLLADEPCRAYADPSRARRTGGAEVSGSGERALRAARRQPTFASVVEPLEELQHRLSRVWSPVSHLNAVMNSEALRASYNACLPLLSDYHTDLAQSEPLYRAYTLIAEHEARDSATGAAPVVEHALREFRLAAWGCDAERKERFKTVMLELSQLHAKFEENVLDATNAWSHHVTAAPSLRGLNRASSSRRARRAREKGVDRLAVLGWISPRTWR